MSMFFGEMSRYVETMEIKIPSDEPCHPGQLRCGCCTEICSEHVLEFLLPETQALRTALQLRAPRSNPRLRIIYPNESAAIPFRLEIHVLEKEKPEMVDWIVRQLVALVKGNTGRAGTEGTTCLAERMLQLQSNISFRIRSKPLSTQELQTIFDTIEQSPFCLKSAIGLSPLSDLTLATAQSLVATTQQKICLSLRKEAECCLAAKIFQQFGDNGELMCKEIAIKFVHNDMFLTTKAFAALGYLLAEVATRADLNVSRLETPQLVQLLSGVVAPSCHLQRLSVNTFTEEHRDIVMQYIQRNWSLGEGIDVRFQNQDFSSCEDVVTRNRAIHTLLERQWCWNGTSLWELRQIIMQESPRLFQHDDDYGNSNELMNRVVSRSRILRELRRLDNRVFLALWDLVQVDLDNPSADRLALALGHHEDDMATQYDILLQCGGPVFAMIAGYPTPIPSRVGNVSNSGVQAT